MQDLTDNELLERVALQDREAFRALYERTSPRLFALAVRMLANRALAEELLQDVYLRVWYTARDFSAQRGSANAWLTTMTRNKAIDAIRNKGNQGVALQAAPEQTLAEREPSFALLDNQRLRVCLAELEDTQRQSIFAAFFDGLTHIEIANRFREPVGTIKSRIRRGLQALRGCLNL